MKEAPGPRTYIIRFFCALKRRGAGSQRPLYAESRLYSSGAGKVELSYHAAREDP